MQNPEISEGRGILCDSDNDSFHLGFLELILLLLLRDHLDLLQHAAAHNRRLGLEATVYVCGTQ